MNIQDPAANTLAAIVRNLVNSPDRVSVEVTQEGSGSLLKLHVPADDLERVRGMGGRTERSLQTVLSALGKKTGQRLRLEIKPYNV